MANAQKPTLKYDGFQPVAVETLCSATSLEFDLYYPPEGPNANKLYRERNVPCSASDFQRLIDAGIETLFVPSEMARTYRDYLRHQVLRNENISVANRYQMLKDAARVTFSEVLRSGDSASVATVAHDLGGQLASLLNRSDLLLSDLVNVMLHDYSTYTHVTHVATYSVMLACKLGISDIVELTEIAKGGLLHDIGKRFVSIDILEKPGRLDTGEQSVIRDHPRCGFVELCQREEMSWGALMMVYQHHERWNGTGYPVGSVGDEIHRWARICAIADVFDAMSNDRSYHTGAAVGEVLKFFERQAGLGFDEEMVRCWNTMIENSLLPS